MCYTIKSLYSGVVRQINVEQGMEIGGLFCSFLGPKAHLPHSFLFDSDMHLSLARCACRQHHVIYPAGLSAGAACLQCSSLLISLQLEAVMGALTLPIHAESCS